MKTTAFWVAAVVLSGCGLGAGLGNSASSSSNLNGSGTSVDDGGIAKAEGGGGPECPQPSAPPYACEVEATALKGCTLSGAACTAELAAFDACQALAPPPPFDPCEAQFVAYKQCVTAPGAGKCDAELDAANVCVKLYPPPPQCLPPPPKKEPCDGDFKGEDPCLPLIESFKDCAVKTPGAACDALLTAFDSCEAKGSTPPPGPSKP